MSSYTTKVLQSIPELIGGNVFNTSNFHALRENSIRCYLLVKSDKILAHIVFTLHDREAISGYRATFGSVDLFDTVSEDTLVRFIQDIRVDLASYDIDTITIANPALCYPNADYIENSLISAGYEVIGSELNQHLDVTQQEFGDVIRRSELSKLKIALSSEFKSKLVTVDQLPEIYKLIVETHQRKGYPVSLSFDDLASVIKEFPDRYLLFCLYDKETLIAATVSILVTDKVMYNFYHGDDYTYRSKSPLVMLIGEIYSYCQQHSIDTLDLGISTVAGELNDGLFNFKKHLGCKVSQKNRLRLSNV
jgi:hypothetical protein